MDTVSAYNTFLYVNEILKYDSVNLCGLEVWDEKDKEWKDWYSVDDLDIDEYAEECSRADELDEFAKELWKQIDRSKLK